MYSSEFNIVLVYPEHIGEIEQDFQDSLSGKTRRDNPITLATGHQRVGRQIVTLFEYLTAANTLILSFAVLRVLACVPHALRPGRLYWVHLSWLSAAISFCLIGFWGFWGFRELEWTFPLFIGALAPTTLAYVFTSLVAPSEPSTVASWRDYFFSARIPILGTGALHMGAVLISNQALLGISAFQLASLGPWTLLAICAIGASSAKPRLHTVLAFGPPILAVITILVLAEPNSLASYAR